MAPDELERENRHLRRLTDTLAQEQQELRRLVGELRRERTELLERCTSLQQEVGTLSNLYVASHRLHETIGRADVLRAVEEILIDLVGSEEFAIFELSAVEPGLSLASSFGVERSELERRSLDEGPLGEAVRTGTTIIVDERGNGERPLTACVPLKLDGRVIGVIAVFRLLAQR